MQYLHAVGGKGRTFSPFYRNLSQTPELCSWNIFSELARDMTAGHLLYLFNLTKLSIQTSLCVPVNVHDGHAPQSDLVLHCLHGSREKFGR